MGSLAVVLEPGPGGTEALRGAGAEEAWKAEEMAVAARVASGVAAEVGREVVGEAVRVVDLAEEEREVEAPVAAAAE